MPLSLPPPCGGWPGLSPRDLATATALVVDSSMSADVVAGLAGGTYRLPAPGPPMGTRGHV
jgi:hypothetical protein